jgi:hypothetical protein
MAIRSGKPPKILARLFLKVYRTLTSSLSQLWSTRYKIIEHIKKTARAADQATQLASHNPPIRFHTDVPHLLIPPRNHKRATRKKPP